eukprot:CAMPEP_0173463746 /NCGR_PEP_ID=MMETSP1357-20121228/68808_1 /TAXON_ID=77926 /ORGANISM="Hemiselmis rufescens, Strain PCC563" /LENGTH=71 /DNA_ID=CAMNT_0014431585 /DNA_START=477 /DNA_END=689 /DNA_ORIENTATION=-
MFDALEPEEVADRHFPDDPVGGLVLDAARALVLAALLRDVPGRDAAEGKPRGEFGAEVFSNHAVASVKVVL